MTFQGRDVITYPDFSGFPPGTVKHFWMDIVANGIGQDIHVPVMLARGVKDGPILGLTAVVHGNELNGLSLTQRLFSDLDVNILSGTVVGIPVVNVPSILTSKRRFIDGEDLNRIFPGDPRGNVSEVYAHRIVDRIVSKFDYHVDLHTASFGRINSFYVRADMKHLQTARMARLQNADIILNASESEGTLRSAAMELGIPSITVEVGDPNRFQKGMIRSGLAGTFNVMSDLGMLEGSVDEPDTDPITCSRSYWLYADRGGIVEVKPDIGEKLDQGEQVAVVRDVFGEVVKRYEAPEDGVVIGKHVHPINQTGGRILHLGII